MGKLVEFVKKHKERVTLVGVGISFLFFIGGGILLQNLNKKSAEELPPAEPEKVELQVKEFGEEGDPAGETGHSSSFLLQPSADMLVQQLQEMQQLRPDVAQKKLQALRVLWPVYFFEVQGEGEQKAAYFDISKEGFGVVIKTKYSGEKFPELEGLAAGRRLWLGGEIVAVDLTGTGGVELNLEYVDFSEGVPGVAVPKEEKSTQ